MQAPSLRPNRGPERGLQADAREDRLGIRPLRMRWDGHSASWRASVTAGMRVAARRDHRKID